MMNSTVVALWRQLADHLWQSTMFAVAVWLIAFLLRNSRARVRYGLWLTASVKLLLPFSLLVAAGALLPQKSKVISPAQAPLYADLYASGDAIGRPFANLQFPQLSPRRAQVRHEHTLNYSTVLLVVWLFGAAGVASMWFLRWRRITGIKRQSVEAPLGREAMLLRRLNPSNAVPLLLTGEYVEPGIVGITRPVLIWPIELSERLDDREMEAILKHELLHVSRHDNMLLMLHMLVETVFWFHPMVWWLEGRLIEERERACDEAVMEAGTDAEVYASSILQACRFCLESPLPCAAGISGAQLNGRIRAIMRFRFVKMGFAARTCLLSFTLLAVALPMMYGLVRATPFYGQILHADGPLPTFEVATIKPWKAAPLPLPPVDGGPPKIVQAAPVGDRRQSSDRVHIIGQVSVLMMSAYNLPIDPSRRIIGGPAWADSQNDRYEINAKIDPSEFASMQNMTNAEQRKRVSLMEQSLLADRFKLKIHFETREIPVYALVVAKTGSKLKAAEESEASRLGSTRSTMGNELTANAITMAELVNYPPLWPGRPIVDQTGLQGRFSFTLKWSSGDSSETGPESPSLFPAIQEQLGLKLVPTKGTVEVIVIDHIERPTGN